MDTHQVTSIGQHMDTGRRMIIDMFRTSGISDGTGKSILFCSHQFHCHKKEMKWQANLTTVHFQKKVNIAALQCANCSEEVYVRPYQANIAMKRYPLNRGVYYILKENYSGLGKGFVNFLTHEKGQLIFRRGYLVPDRMGFQIRKANVSE